MPTSELAISVRDLGKAYTIWHNQPRATTLPEAIGAGLGRLLKPQAGSKEIFWALREVSFDVRRGQAIGIIGRNGAGKSTLLKILSRITEPTTGQVNLYGRVSSLLEVGTGFHTELTGRENIYLNGSILGMRRKEIQSQFDAIVDFAGVEQFLDTPVKRYSSGMYVRLAFAVAAHLQSEILLVDEVLAVGDAQFQQKCLGKMKDVATGGRTVLFVSHNMAAIADLCSSAMVISGGRIALAGDIQSCIASYLGEGGANEARFTVGPLKSVAICQRGEQLELTARYECETPIDVPAFGFVISDAMGQAICGANPRVYGARPERATRAGVVKAVLRQPRLIDGNYRLSVWFGDSQSDFLNHRDCLTFRVTGMAGARQLTAGGSVYAECEWGFE
ncbi:MAG: ABC transporter ATP-binding protein [Tepidisphaeraceae bacterium]|jgi:lipopolysaccharide transport system ATP-binding protein